MHIEEQIPFRRILKVVRWVKTEGIRQSIHSSCFPRDSTRAIFVAPGALGKELSVAMAAAGWYLVGFQRFTLPHNFLNEIKHTSKLQGIQGRKQYKYSVS